MKKNYYVRYYQTDDKKMSFQDFLQRIASCGLRLISCTEHSFTRQEFMFREFTTIWEIDERRDYSGLNEEIMEALKINPKPKITINETTITDEQ